MTERLAGIGDEAASSLERQIAIHADLGLAGLELRTVDGEPVDRVSARALAEAVAAAGLVVPAIDTTLGNWETPVTADFAGELELLRCSAAVAHELGCRFLRIMSYPNDGLEPERWRDEAIRRVAALAREAERLDVVLLHENCAGWAGQGPDEAVQLLEAVASPNLQLLFDPGNCVVYGIDPLELLEATVDHVAHVHVKDARRSDGTTVFTAPGEGDARLGECLDLLERAGYSGWLSIEPHLQRIPHLHLAAADDELEAAYRGYAGSLRELLQARAARETSTAR
jgi:sugar phosphate isomerase/epimerase